jgi:hypothetical protein
MEIITVIGNITSSNSIMTNKQMAKIMVTNSNSPGKTLHSTTSNNNPGTIKIIHHHNNNNNNNSNSHSSNSNNNSNSSSKKMLPKTIGLIKIIKIL